MDQSFSTWITGLHGHKILDYFFLILTYLSEYGALWILLFLFFIIYLLVKKKKVSLTFLLGFLMFAIVWIMLDGKSNPISIKNLVQRVRPYHVIAGFEEFMTSLHYKLPSGYSFPSGHAFASFFGAFTIFFYKKKTGYVLIPIAFLIAFSRVWLGAHYLSDILVGGAIGVFFAFVDFMIVKQIFKNEKLENSAFIR